MNSSYPKANLNIDDRHGTSPAERGAFRFTTRRNEPGQAVPATNTAPVSHPPKTRPRGRLLIAGLMLLACSVGVATVWDSLFRYRAYGVVTGRIIEVAVPIDGVLTAIQVSEGDVIRQDTPMAKVVDLEFEQQLARVSDEMRVVEATLQAEIARVQWRSHVDETEMSKSIADLFESAGRLQDGHGSLDLLRYQLDLAKELHDRKATTPMVVREFTIQEKAKKEELDFVQKATTALKERAERAAASPRLGAEQIQPLIAKSEMLLNEIARLREKIAQGNLRSPVNGTVLRRYHPAGECIKSHEPLFSVMEESSMEIEIYLPQHMSHDYQVGDTVELKIEPFEELVACRVTAIGSEHRRPPEHIEVYYRSNVRLLPIRLKPVVPPSGEKKFSVGAVAKLPHFGAIR